MKRIVGLSLLAIILLTVGILPALAGTSTFTGTLTGSDPIYSIGRPDDADCGSIIDDLLPQKYVYHLLYVGVTETGTYSYIDNRSTASTIDIEVAVFDGPFNPNSPTDNCLSSMDDSNTINLEAGKQYILAVTSWDIPTTGPYSFSLTGPGDVFENTGAGTCPYPLPSNAVMSNLPAGAPAFWSPDLSHTTGFNIPAGTWWTYGTDGDFTHLWIACQGEPVWVPTNAVAP
ncbi:MAG: hypothetical protein U0521_26600 [Anaerolineae bacterium]